MVGRHDAGEIDLTHCPHPPLRYEATVGVGWLEQGNCYVQANIRGGGEYGPSWHQAAVKENRHKTFEDFEAVARDLIAIGEGIYEERTKGK
jgi:prolyl oligopeptidase PreP (S9A serine peptidase family)